MGLVKKEVFTVRGPDHAFFDGELRPGWQGAGRRVVRRIIIRTPSLKADESLAPAQGPQQGRRVDVVGAPGQDLPCPRLKNPSRARRERRHHRRRGRVPLLGLVNDPKDEKESIMAISKPTLSTTSSCQAVTCSSRSWISKPRSSASAPMMAMAAEPAGGAGGAAEG